MARQKTGHYPVGKNGKHLIDLPNRLKTKTKPVSRHLNMRKNTEKAAEILALLGGPFLKLKRGLLEHHGISLTQACFIVKLAERDMTMTAAAHVLGFSTAACTGMVDKVEKLGFVARVRNPDDRRTINLTVTPKGCNLILAIQSAIETTLDEESVAQERRQIRDKVESRLRTVFA